MHFNMYVLIIFDKLDPTEKEKIGYLMNMTVGRVLRLVD